MSSHQRKHYAKSRLDDLIGGFVPHAPHDVEAFWRLIHAVRASSELLIPRPERGHTTSHHAMRVVRACAWLVSRRHSWHRSPADWIAPKAGSFVQFRSLVSHLFDHYPVPAFMTQVWLNDFAEIFQEMYLHLATGRSIRDFRLPIPFRLSRQAAAYFMQAPHDLHPLEAMRWAHIRSLGGDDRLSRLLLARTVLIAPSDHEPFWESVIRFLIRHSTITADEIVAIVQFIDEQRFQPAETVWGPGAGQKPLQPEFTVTGRSLMSLRRHMANWRTEFQPHLPPFCPTAPLWEKSNIGSFRHADGQSIWTIDELLTDKELRVEGGIMHHCVATYIPACARRRTSIWSMKVQQDGCRERRVTIEVLPNSKTICQVKGKRNSPPNDLERAILQRWAHQEGLRFSRRA